MKIDEAKYEGYLWWSDKTTPQVITPQKPFSLEMANDQNPFVVEGFLWDEDNKISYSIKYVDGAYFCQRYALSDLESLDYELKEFEPNRMKDKGVSGLVFRQYWRAYQDELCENMKTLMPAELVFVGFNNLSGFNKKKEE